jgi:carbon starvation protein
MLLESLVGIMALVAACTLDPGVYLSMNIAVPGPTTEAITAGTVAKVTALGFPITAQEMTALARTVHEENLCGRTGGAATLAVGMAHIFGRVFGEKPLAIWYHFALMFEALFILTTLDAGTRVGRYLLQDSLGHFSRSLGDTQNLVANVAASAAVVGAWGYFLLKAVYDPESGIKALWPIFGIANQLLASIALCLATTVILKMQLQPAKDADSRQGSLPSGRPALALVTLLPLCWLLTVTSTAAVQKIWHHDPRIGFLAKAREIEGKLPAQEQALRAAYAAAATKIFDSPESRQLDQVLKETRTLRSQRFNQRLDAVVTGVFLSLVVAIVLLSVREWLLLLGRRKLADLRETQPVWLPEEALGPDPSLPNLGLVALTLLLAKELSGEAAIERQRQQVALCPEKPAVRLLIDVPDVRRQVERDQRAQAYLAASEQRYRGVNRCC